MSILTKKRTWWIITSFWTIFYFVFVILNFYFKNAYEFMSGSFGTLYIGILSIYVGSKEFDRWYEIHRARRHGEMFMVAFSILLFFCVVGSAVLGKSYMLPSDVFATYIATLSIFVITQKSKELYEKKHGMDA